MNNKLLIKTIALCVIFTGLGMPVAQATAAAPLAQPDGPDSCVVNTLPYIERLDHCNLTSFYDTVNFVPCWGRMNNSPSRSAGNIHLYVNYPDTIVRITPNGTGTQYVILPPLADSLLNGDQLYLHIKLYSSMNLAARGAEVGAMTDPTDTSTFRTIQMLPMIYYGNDTIVPLSSLMPGEQLAIRAQLASLQYLYIYGVVVDRVPTCGVVYNFRSTKIGYGATFAEWDYWPNENTATDSTTFVVRVYESGQTTPVTELVTNRKSAILSNLPLMNTSHRVTVTAVCGAAPDSSTNLLSDDFTLRTMFTYASCPEPLVVLKNQNEYDATIEWGAGEGSDSLWNIYLREEYVYSSGPWVMVDSAYRGSTYTLHDLTPGTSYSIRVNPLCDTSRSSTPNKVTVHTPCLPVSQLPWEEDFERFNYTCWRAIPVGGDIMAYRSLSITNINPQRYYTLPEMPADLNSLTITGISRGHGFVIGVTDSDATVFHPIDTVLNTTDSTWEAFSVSLTDAPFSSGLIYLTRMAFGNSTGASVDNLKVDYTSSCTMPSHVLDSAVTAQTALIKWRPEPDAMTYEVEYGLSGFAHGEGSSVFVTTNRATIGGMMFGRRHDVYVRAFCSSSDTSEWSNPISITTQCADIATLPWSQEINTPYTLSGGAGPIPCWTKNVSFSNQLTTRMVPTPSGDTVMGLYLGHSGNGEMASAPRLTALNRAQYLQARLTAWTQHEYSTPAEVIPTVGLEVGVSSDPASAANFTPIDTLQLSYEPSPYEVSFANYAGNGRYITFRGIGGDHYPLYLKYIELDMLPACLRPDRLSVSANGTTQALLDWRERGEATQWQIAYGRRGEEIDTTIIVSTHPYMLTGLAPDEEYEFRVRSLCGSGNPSAPTDTSGWSLQGCSFFTLTPPASIPYVCDFEDTVEAGQWMSMSAGFYAWNYSLLDSPTADHGYEIGIRTDMNNDRYFYPHGQLITNAVLFRDVDFGQWDNTSTLPPPRYNVSFRAKAVTSRNWPHLYKVRVYMADAAELPVLDNTFGSSCWDESRYLLAELSLDSNWQTFTLSLDTATGVHRLAFALSNNTLDMQLSIDDVQIAPDPCPRPYGLHLDQTTDSVAEISWVGYPTSQYVATWMGPDSIARTDTTLGPQLTLTGLSRATQYSVRVALVCETGELSELSAPLLFYTLLCDSLRCDTVTAASTEDQLSNVVPVSQLDRYSYSQQLFPSALFSGPGTLSAVNLNYRLNCADTDRNDYIVYIGHTNKQFFANASDFVDPAGLSIVYAGPLPQGDGWHKIIFDAPFAYDGNHTLVLAIASNNNTVKPIRNLVEATTQNSIVEVRGETPIEPASTEALHRYVGNRNIMAFRSQALFDFCPDCACSGTELLPPFLRYERATVSWRPTTVGNYELNYRPYAQPHWNDPIFTTDTAVTLRELTPGVHYLYRVRTLCPPDAPQIWVYGLFRIEPSACPPPQNLTVADLAPEEVTLQWDLDEDLHLFHLHLFNTVFDTTIITADDHYTFTTLLHGVLYKASVHATCNGMTTPGRWSDTVSFTTLTCPDATDLTILNLRSNSVELDWQSPDTVESWEITYGEHGFINGTGTTVSVDRHPYVLTGLECPKEYDVYVRSMCGAGFYSEHWSNLVTFTTHPSGIGNPEETAGFTVSPNPVRGSFMVIPNGLSAGPTLVTVRDAHGRTVCQSTSIESPISLADSPAGIYFVTLTTPLSSSTRKIIVE